ncbi:hypothetical protein ACTPC8_18480, partial [Clostridioides difficile]|uniref:hypothetical protein n=1 Tax=Clostridioides difficile TaxID=1496 RepID=UPI003F8D69E4
KNICYKDLGNYLLNFNADGLFYCNDIENLGSDVKKVLKPQGIVNILPQLSELYFKYTFQFISFVLFFLISHY